MIIDHYYSQTRGISVAKNLGKCFVDQIIAHPFECIAEGNGQPHERHFAISVLWFGAIEPHLALQRLKGSRKSFEIWLKFTHERPRWRALPEEASAMQS